MNASHAGMAWAIRVGHVALLWGGTMACASAGDFDCMIEPVQVVEVRSPVVGLLESVHVRRGQSVRRGELLVTIESSVEASAATAAQYKAQATGALAQAQAKVNATRAKAQRMEELFAEEFVSAQARDDAVAEFKQAQTELQVAQENGELARLDARQAVDQLQRRTLRSPFDGVVMDQFLFPGALVDSSDGKKPILKLAQTRPLLVRAILPYRHFPAARVGTAAQVMPEAPFNTGAQARISATIKTVDRVIDSAAGTFGVFLELPNERQSLPGGIRCKLRISGIE
ncbi:efflux RND transporter periplasmic adaptor subunit [Roseateles sp. DB2]|uniref:efflux RND transporter periplasmic adaptor subunit n=1 Tax=Roseateles sp. DB2 TaxID=3453717 RepID=UPI003EEC5DF4